MIMIHIRNSGRYETYVKSFLKRQFITSKIAGKTDMDAKPVETSIKQKLEAALKPIHMDILNESYMHNVPKGSETHFKVVLVSKEFENKTLLQRHRLVNSALDYELKNGVHALSIVAKTPDQWDKEEKIVPSPKCLGGFGK